MRYRYKKNYVWQLARYGTPNIVSSPKIKGKDITRLLLLNILNILIIEIIYGCMDSGSLSTTSRLLRFERTLPLIGITSIIHIGPSVCPLLMLLHISVTSELYI